MLRRVVSRRSFLETALALAATSPFRRLTRTARQAPTRLVLLGTAGGPRPSALRAAPGYAVRIGDRTYLVDCGDGVSRQLALAKIPLSTLKAVFITHQHSDHNAGYGPLLSVGWTQLQPVVQVFGPPPLEQMTKLWFEMNAFDIELRVRDEQRRPLAGLVRARDVANDGPVYEDEWVRVRAAHNHHPPIEHSLAYRIDAADRSIVFSGDTTYSDGVVTLARSADVLVHEVYDREYVESGKGPYTPGIRRHIVATHTSPEDVGRAAAAAGVRTVVLSHFVPNDAPEIRDEHWTAGVRKHFAGTVIAGRDLMEI
jgi:ribonuclease BN (tRNA processing enzyme)